jgi:hypothetical protein
VGEGTATIIFRCNRLTGTVVCTQSAGNNWWPVGHRP